MTRFALYMITTYTIHTLHRGRMIQILLGSLFVAGGIASFWEISEIYKILILLFSLPAVLFCSVKFSQQPSKWMISEDVVSIEKGSKTYEIPIKNLEYIKNHIRSGGNLIAIYKRGKRTPLRFWRNKIFQSNDDFDSMSQAIKDLKIPFMIG